MALAEVRGLRALHAKAKSAAVERAKFTVANAVFSHTKQGYRVRPTVGMDIHNGTNKAVAGFRCKARLTSPGREVPWLEETFSYSPDGGVAPGEKQSLSLLPNEFGAWGKVPKDRKDLVLTLSVIELTGTDGEDLFAVDFDDDDAKRLAALEEMVLKHGWK